MSKIWQALKEAELQREPEAASRSYPSSLSMVQHDAVRALLRHESVGDAAAACGVSPGTLEGWLKTPQFVAAYHIASRAARARRQ